MKKILTTILFAFMAVVMFAQSNNPYRMVVHQKDGTTRSFTVQDVDSVSFKKILGNIGVEVEIHEINTDNPENEYIIASFTPTEECKKYRFTVVPKITSDVYSSSIEAMRQYFDGDPSLPTISEALKEAKIEGLSFRLLPGVQYSIMVLSYDDVDVAANAQVYDFKVPEVPLVGNPSVEIHVDETTATTAKMTFTPNADCSGYYTCFFEPGLAEKQFKEFAPIIGFACMGDMIKAFGQELHTEQFSTVWDELAPGVDYEAYVQPLDANGNYAPMCTAIVSTKKIGGEGVAEMSIELGDLTYDKEYEAYFKKISFIPNDQTTAHRDIVAKKEAFDNGTWTEEKLLDYMKHDKNPDYPDFIEDPDWDQYGIHTGDFPVNPGKTYYVYTIGKNLNGEYGPFVKVEFTVPENPDVTPATMKNADDDNQLVREIKASGLKYKNGNIQKKIITVKR